MLQKLLQETKSLANKENATLLSSFFKTKKGEYGEGDIFLGIIVPIQRSLASKYKDLPLSDVAKLLQSKIHEQRLIALFILRLQYTKAGVEAKEKIIRAYLRNLKFVNNWDLVDSSAPYLLGEYLKNKNRDLLYKLVESNNLWEKRVAVLSTFAFIKASQFEDGLKIAEILVDDKHDLIQKAVGWMLREIGNKDQEIEIKFLDKYYKIMPRTMLRYAIEKFDKQLREFYLSKI